MPRGRIPIGKIGRPHGVSGLVHVASYTDPPEAIAAYGPLADEQNRQLVLRWRGDGLAEVTEVTARGLVRVADRTAAAQLTNARLFVERARLPAPDEDEFYLADLIGLRVRDEVGADLGLVIAVHDYGAGASLEIGKAGMVIPFTRAAVPVVDIAGGCLTVAPPASVDAPPPAELRAPCSGEPGGAP